MAADIITNPRTAMTVMIITRSELLPSTPVKKHCKNLKTNLPQSSQ